MIELRLRFPAELFVEMVDMGRALFGSYPELKSTDASRSSAMERTMGEGGTAVATDTRVALLRVGKGILAAVIMPSVEAGLSPTVLERVLLAGVEGGAAGRTLPLCEEAEG